MMGLSGLLVLWAQVETATKSEVLRLDDVLVEVAARYPALAEARARVEVARAQLPGVEAWPDPQIVFEQWHLPLTRPWAYDHAMMVMVGVRQMLPLPGARAQAARAVQAEVDRRQATSDQVAQEALARARKAYFAYYRAEYEFRTHIEHVAITTQILELARSGYRSGRGSQDEVLRGALQLARRHQELSAVDRLRKSSRALLNTLRAKAPQAPIGAPEPPDPPILQLKNLEQQLFGRPALVAAEKGVERERATLAGAELAARWPNVMVGLDYMFRPDAHDQRHGYGAMVQLDLPWLSDARRSQVAEAQAAVNAETHALQAARFEARYALYEAWSRYEAAVETCEILHRDLIPEAERSFEAARAAYAGAQGDARRVLESLQTLLEVQLEHIRARAEAASAAVDAQLAAGVPL